MISTKDMTQHLEDIEQKKLVKWCYKHRREYPELQLLFAIPNGAYFGKDRFKAMRQMVRLKAGGLKKGVPDLFLPFPNSEFHGLFIEMKSLKGVASPEQKQWIEKLSKLGYRAEVCKGGQQALDVIMDYLGKDHVIIDQ